MADPRITRPALLSAVAYILQAAGITPDELAQHMGQQLALPVLDGVDIDAVHRKPASPKKGREPHNKGKTMPLSSAAMRLVELADCEEGATIPDLCAGLGVNDSTVHHHLKRLTQERLITRVKIAGQASPLYFARPAHAAAYVEANKPAPAPAPAAAPQSAVLSEAELKTLATNEKKRQAARKAAPPLGPRTVRQQDAGTIIPPRIDDSRMRPQGQPIETEATRRTIDSTRRPNSRIEAAPPLPPDPRWPSFSDEWKRLRGEATA